MKYCSHCGGQIPDNALFCTYCGTQVENTNNTENAQPQQTASVYSPQPQTQNNAPSETKSGYHVAIKVLLILSCIGSIWMFCIPLAWMLPMTIYAFNKMKENKPFGIGFSICVILFVNLIAGILMICMKDEN